MQSTSSGSGLFSFLSGIFAHIFGQIVSVIRKSLRNTNLVASIYFKMKKTSLLVDEWPSKTLLLNLPIVDVLSCNQWMKGKKYFWYFTHRFTRVMKDKLPKLHVFLHCCSALKVFPLTHNSYVRTQGNFTDILKYWQGHVYTRDSGNHLESTLLFSYVPIGHRITQIQPECFFLHRPLPDLAFNLKWLITIFLRLGPYNRFIIKVLIHFEFQGDRFFVMDNEFSNLASLMSLPWCSFCVLSNSEIRSFWSETNQNIHCYCIW